MILFLEIPINKNDVNNLRKLYPNIKVFNYSSASTTFANILGIYTDLAFKLDEDFLKKYINLKYIATPTTSLTHIDTDFCIKNKIEIFSLKNHKDVIKNFTATAEVTWWHIFELFRKFSKAQASVAKGEWNRRSHITSTIAGKKLGIIGYGRLGARVAKIARAFEMQVYTYDIDPMRQSSDNEVISLKQIEQIFEKCEVVSIHVDDRPENKNLIDSKLFQSITKPGTILVNTSRGFVLNEKDALDALEQKLLGGLGLDVLQDEEVQNNEKLWVKNNLIINKKINSDLNISITPHIGGATKETLTISTHLVLDQLFKAVGSIKFK